jgi:heme/copper-type cytochrome/quinol oxidase subunit 3
MRWIIAVLVLLLGLALAAFAVFGGAFSTGACLETPPDWIYYLLLAVSGVLVVAAAVAAFLIVKRASIRRILLTGFLGFLFSCFGYAAYIALLGAHC